MLGRRLPRQAALMATVSCNSVFTLSLLNTMPVHITERLCTVSECLEHGPPGIWAHLDPVLKYNREKYPLMMTLFSDGPSSQYYRQKKTSTSMRLNFNPTNSTPAAGIFSKLDMAKARQMGSAGMSKEKPMKLLPTA